MKHVCLFILSVLLFFHGNAQHRAEKIEGTPLPNLFKIDDGVYRCNQPDRSGFLALEKMGVKEVLNLRNYHSDDKKAAGTALTLHRVKMNAHHISDQAIIEALSIIKNRAAPIVIHCKHGSDRTGVVCAMYRILYQNYTKQQAVEELSDGFGFHAIFVNIPNYIYAVDIERIRAQIK